MPASLKTMAAPIELSMDASIAAVLSELDNISSLKEEQRTAPKAFLGGKDVFALLLTGFGKSSTDSKENGKDSESHSDCCLSVDSPNRRSNQRGLEAGCRYVGGRQRQHPSRKMPASDRQP